MSPASLLVDNIETHCSVKANGLEPPNTFLDGITNCDTIRIDTKIVLGCELYHFLNPSPCLEQPGNKESLPQKRSAYGAHSLHPPSCKKPACRLPDGSQGRQV